MFGDKGYQTTKDELKVNLLGRECIDMLLSNNLTQDIRKQALGYIMFLKRKQSEKMKARNMPIDVHNENTLQKKNQVH